MISYPQRPSFISELFKQRQLRSLKASEQQMQISKQSIIYKKKCNSNVHSLLFCKVFNATSSQFSTLNQKKILDEEKAKYFDYVRKTFKQKIPEDFENQHKLRKALKMKIQQKKQNESNKNEDQSFKRQRKQPQQSKQKVKKQKQKQQNRNKKLKTLQQKNQKQIVVEKDELDNPFEDDQNIESEIDLHNDEIEESYVNQQDQF